MEPPKRNTKAVCTPPSRSWHIFKGQDCKKPGRKCNWEGKYMRRGSSTLLGSSNHGRVTDRMALEVREAGGRKSAQSLEWCGSERRLALKAVWDRRSVKRNYNLLGLEFSQIHQRFYSKYPKLSKLEMGTEGQMAETKWWGDGRKEKKKCRHKPMTDSNSRVTGRNLKIK